MDYDVFLFIDKSIYTIPGHKNVSAVYPLWIIYNRKKDK